MKPVTLYTKPTCPYCNNAKALLSQLGVGYTDHDVAANTELRAQISESVGGYKTVPMIFIGDEFIGGFSDLNNLHQSGALMAKLEG